jgi:hypothetical protein
MISLPGTFHSDDNVARMKSGVRLAAQGETGAQGRAWMAGFLPRPAQVK